MVLVLVIDAVPSSIGRRERQTASFQNGPYSLEIAGFAAGLAWTGLAIFTSVIPLRLAAGRANAMGRRIQVRREG
jgi:hypothetical protein